MGKLTKDRIDFFLKKYEGRELPLAEFDRFMKPFELAAKKRDTNIAVFLITLLIFLIAAIMTLSDATP